MIVARNCNAKSIVWMHAILDRMVKRLFALVVALAMVSAPVALEVCQMTCESKAMAPSMPRAESHAGRHHIPAGHASCDEHVGAPELSPSSVACDHGLEAMPSLVAAKIGDAAVSLLGVLPFGRAIGTVATRDFVSKRQSFWPDRLGVPLVVPRRV